MEKNNFGQDVEQKELKTLALVRKIAFLLDNSIPIGSGRFRIGLDPIIGLIPGIGDLLAVLFSTSILFLAIRIGASPWTLGRMVCNIVIEGTVGTLPIIGDIFDGFFKANQRNYLLLEESLHNPKRASLDKRQILFMTGAVLFFLLFVGWVGFVLFMKLLYHLQRW